MARQYTRRVNLVLTRGQGTALRAWAAQEGRTVPNLVRRLLELQLATRPGRAVAVWPPQAGPVWGPIVWPAEGEAP
jgi:hypothetical protein